MRLRGFLAGLLPAASAIALAGAAEASETTSYSYDSLGRLVRVERSGGPAAGLNSSYGYDCADNRTQVQTGALPAPLPCPAGSPPSSPPVSPPPANRPPTAVADTGAQGQCTTRAYSVLQNDSDPDGDPLTLVSVTGTGFSLAGDLVQFTSLASTGAKIGTYTIRDPSGATASATLTVTVSGGTCSLSAPAADGPAPLAAPPDPPPPPDEGGDG